MIHLPQIGDHYKILTFEKSENPQNILVVYTKLESHCRFVTKNGLPLIDFYWLMDRVHYKPTHSLIKEGVRKRLQVSAARENQFDLQISDLKELKTGLAHPHLVVKIERDGENCRVVSYFPMDKEKTIQVSSIYSESEKTFLPPFRKLLAVTIRGTASGETVQQKYYAR